MRRTVARVEKRATKNEAAITVPSEGPVARAAGVVCQDPRLCGGNSEREERRVHSPMEALVTSSGPLYSWSSRSKYHVPTQPPTVA